MITAQGVSAVSLFRLSGVKAIYIVDKIVILRNKKVNDCRGFTINIGNIYDQGYLLDQVLVYIFKKPQSYTGEDVIEISSHGSLYIQNKILQLCIHHGAYLANPGEFTFRAFYNKKIDLCQAESILDLINSQSKYQHKLAIDNLSGILSNKILQLRDKLINFKSLIELELDFSEENIKFVDYAHLNNLLLIIQDEFKVLLNSFALGNVIKTGVRVVLIGMPNAGKSTLFNALLGKDRSIVSSSPGTTRDFIEENVVFKGYNFIFTDTAGIRKSNHSIEQQGIEKTFLSIRDSDIVIYIFDLSSSVELIEKDFKYIVDNYPDKKYIIVGNKSDHISIKKLNILQNNVLITSAKYLIGVNKVKEYLIKIVVSNMHSWKDVKDNPVITNIRHYEIFYDSMFYIDNILKGIKNKLPGDLLAVDLKYILLNLSNIIGLEISNEDILDNIFSKFCIGK
jgi:tRNA modification GTPase